MLIQVLIIYYIHNYINTENAQLVHVWYMARILQTITNFPDSGEWTHMSAVCTRLFLVHSSVCPSCYIKQNATAGDKAVLIVHNTTLLHVVYITSDVSMYNWESIVFTGQISFIPISKNIQESTPASF